ncbi:tetraacyldisaccharide 4'-kinase [Psychromonas sp. KJ10-10]|uniref:tetraacyldisaccharide 4'-kinase n=1 Tax=Psychromonas sp. KJ10-10 TaxID=3391823 RepID=UPI0039B66D6E
MPVVAIGNPRRFFDTLEAQQYRLATQVAFADHYAFNEDDLTQFDTKIPLLMTEKDAVKCVKFAQSNWWYLPVNAQLPETFEQQLLKRIKEI